MPTKRHGVTLAPLPGMPSRKSAPAVGSAAWLNQQPKAVLSPAMRKAVSDAEVAHKFDEAVKIRQDTEQYNISAESAGSCMSLGERAEADNLLDSVLADYSDRVAAPVAAAPAAGEDNQRSLSRIGSVFRRSSKVAPEGGGSRRGGKDLWARLRQVHTGVSAIKARPSRESRRAAFARSASKLGKSVRDTLSGRGRR